MSNNQRKKAKIAIEVSVVDEDGTSNSHGFSSSNIRIPIDVNINHAFPKMPTLPVYQGHPYHPTYPIGYQMRPIPPPNYIAKVFIWDINDITMLSRHQLAKVPVQCPELAEETHVLTNLLTVMHDYLSFPLSNGSHVFRLDNMKDKMIPHPISRESREGFYIFFGKAFIVEVAARPDADDMIQLCMNKSAGDYRILRELYDIVSANTKKKEVISEELIRRSDFVDRKDEVYRAAEKFQEYFHISWKGINRCLRLVNEKSGQSNKKYANVVVCKDELGYGLMQLLVAGYSKEIPLNNVFSLAHTSIESIFKRIQTTAGKQCSLVFITSDSEYTSVAEKLNIPVWSVEDYDAFDKLYTAQTAFSL